MQQQSVLDHTDVYSTKYTPSQKDTIYNLLNGSPLATCMLPAPFPSKSSPDRSTNKGPYLLRCSSPLPTTSLCSCPSFLLPLSSCGYPHGSREQAQACDNLTRVSPAIYTSTCYYCHTQWMTSGAHQSSGLVGLGLRSRVFISLGKLIDTCKLALQSRQELMSFHGTLAPGGCGRACLRVCSRCCHFHSGTAASVLQALGNSLIRAGKGAKVTHTHACAPVKAVRQNPMRIKAGTNMPVVMRSLLLDGVGMLSLDSKHPGEEHQSLQALSS